MTLLARVFEVITHERVGWVRFAVQGAVQFCRDGRLIAVDDGEDPFGSACG